MAITKTKKIILDDILSMELKTEVSNNYYYVDYDDDSYDDSCEGYTIYWNSLENKKDDYILISRAFAGIYQLTSNKHIGKFVDMDSIYTKDRLREKKIDQILGIDIVVSKTTLGDYLKL